METEYWVHSRAAEKKASTVEMFLEKKNKEILQDNNSEMMTWLLHEQQNKTLHPLSPRSHYVPTRM